MRFAETDSAPSVSSSSAFVQSPWTVDLAPLANHRGHGARAADFVRPAELGVADWPPAPFTPFVLDNLNIGALAGLLEAEGHGALGIHHRKFYLIAAFKPIKSAKPAQCVTKTPNFPPPY